MLKGTIDFYNADRGFGFIKDDSQVRHFFHFSQIAVPAWIGEIEKGKRVAFDVGPTKRDPKKSEAKDIRFLDAA
jgi:cold shock CspA family protein